MTMITTASHSSRSLDVPILDLKSMELKAKSIVRMKLFTLDDTLVVRKIGKLAISDSKNVKNALQSLFNLD